MVDFSKGFNRIHHGCLVEDLFNMGVPPWIVRIVASYLTERKLIIRYKEGNSQAVSLPGGVGQDTLIGMCMFLIKMNKFGEQTKLDKTGDEQTRRQVGYTKKKWVDDLTELNSLDLNRYSINLPVC